MDILRKRQRSALLDRRRLLSYARPMAKKPEIKPTGDAKLPGRERIFKKPWPCCAFAHPRSESSPVTNRKMES